MISADLAAEHSRDLLAAASAAYPVRSRQLSLTARARVLASRLRHR